MKLDMFESFIRYKIKNKKVLSISTPLDENDFNTVLFMSNTAIGDTLFNTPVFRAFKEKYPNKKTIGLFNPSNVSMFKTNPYIDEFLTYSGKWKDFFSILKIVKAKNIDIAFILHSNEPQATPLALLAGSKYIIKIPNHKTFYNKFHSHEALCEIVDKHGIFDRLRSLNFVGIFSNNPQMDIFIQEKYKEEVKNLYQFQQDKIYIGFQIGASTISRMWFEKKWVNLGEKLLKHENVFIVLTGAKNEQRLTSSVKKRLSSCRVLDFAGKLSLNGATSLIDKLDLLVTPDTGPLHIATALKTPTIGLFAVADPIKSNSCYDINKHLYIKKPRTCEPCIAKKCKYQKCMEQIEVQEVLDKIKVLINV